MVRRLVDADEPSINGNFAGRQMPPIGMECGEGGHESPPLEASHLKLDAVEKVPASGIGVQDLRGVFKGQVLQLCRQKCK